MKLHISCKEAVDYINKKEEGKLGIWQQLQLWNHLFICSLCKRFANQSRKLSKLFKTAYGNHQFSEEEKSTLIQTLTNTKE